MEPSAPPLRSAQPGELFERFQHNAERANAEVHRCLSPADAVEVALRVMRRERVANAPGRYALWAPCPLLESLDRAPLLARMPGLRLQVDRGLAAQARVGLSQMQFGLADTGTLVQDATAVAERLVSSLVRVHIAFLASASLAPSLGALIARLRPERASYLAFITGPSRTADIERVLTIGVHGPRQLVIVCVDDLDEQDTPSPADGRATAAAAGPRGHSGASP